MAAAVKLSTGFSPRSARFADTLASEWTKLFSVRSTYIMLALGLVLSYGMTALITFAVGTTFDEWGPAEQAQFEPITFSLVGIIFGGIVYSVFGVLAITGEYSSSMIRLTFTATPQRWRVLAAKALIVSALMVVFSFLMMIGMFLIGQAIMDAYGMPAASLSDGGVQRTLVGLIAFGPAFPLMGLALGFLLRSTAAAITTVLAIIWVPEIFESLLPMWWRENVVSRLPGTSMDSVTIGHIIDSPVYGDPIVGAAVGVGWIVLFLGAAYLSLARRDA